MLRKRVSVSVVFPFSILYEHAFQKLVKYPLSFGINFSRLLLLVTSIREEISIHSNTLFGIFFNSIEKTYNQSNKVSLVAIRYGITM